VSGRGSCLALAAAVLACQAGEPVVPSVDAGEVVPDAAADVPPPRICVAPAGAGSPRSIAEVVTLVNALPHPVTLPCFLESLDRPLRANATHSTISLQPARGLRSPRVFLFFDGLILSVVPAGPGQRLIEMGEFVDSKRTIKAEIEFPLAAALAAREPYEHPRTTVGTLCASCHANETRAPSIDFAEAYVSDALKPTFRADVDLAVLRAERSACDPAVEPDRCAMLGAIFDHGEVLRAEFPEELPTIFD
jgi:hypothetical protein